MPKVTFLVSDAHKQVMDDHPDVNWSEVFRQAIWQHADREEIARRILEEINDPKVKAITKIIKERVGRKFMEDVRAYRRGRKYPDSRPAEAGRVDRKRTLAARSGIGGSRSAD